MPTAPAYDPDQVAMIKLAAANFTGGRRAEAARESNAQGLITDPRIKHALDTATSKSYLPESLRAEMKDVPAWQVLHQGARATRKMGPSIKLNYAGIYSMTCLVGDDHTPDLYVAVPDGNGWFDMMRPQLLVLNDFRASYILSRRIVPRPQYTAFDVQTAFKRALKRFGLPRFILREGGIWRKSRLVNSLAEVGNAKSDRRESPYSAPEIEFGLERKGVLFCDTPEQVAQRLGEAGIEFRESYHARSKPVAGLIRLLSNIIERLPGYCGRNI